MARLERVRQEGVARERLLKAALRALLHHFEYRLKTHDPLSGFTKDVPTVLREALEA